MSQPNPQANLDFIAILMEMREGRVVIDCSQKMRELIAAIRDTGKGGSLTLQLRFSPSRAESDVIREMELEHTCTIKKPHAKIPRSRFYVSEDGSLTWSDPGQIQMDLEPTPAPPEAPAEAVAVGQESV